MAPRLSPMPGRFWWGSCGRLRFIRVKANTMNKETKVILIKNHPWTGEMGILLGKEKTPFGEMYRIRSTSTGAGNHECYAKLGDFVILPQKKDPIL
jgi:hypothetical protein